MSSLRQLRITAFIAVVRSTVLVLLRVVDAFDKHARLMLRRLQLVILRSEVALADLKYERAHEARINYPGKTWVGQRELRVAEAYARDHLIECRQTLKEYADVVDALSK